MRKLMWNVLLAVLISFAFSACEKDQFLPETEEPESAFDLNYLRVGVRPAVSFAAGPTELGEDRANPYTVRNIEAAYLEIDRTTVNLAPTHRYIRFKPEDAEDMELLDDADLFLLDFPWTRKIIKQGDYYHTPRNDEDFPLLYTVVEMRQAIPAVEYELIDELYLAENRVSILGQAFARTGNAEEFEEILATSLRCEEDDDTIVFEPADCGNTSSGGGTRTTINDCGCEIYVEQRKPGGCLRVDDVQLASPGQTENFAGVRRVKVFAKDSWFTIRETFTDDNGCWKIDRNYSGRAWINFRFKNDDRNKIRSNFFDFITTTSAVKVSTGRINGPNFHDIQLNLFRQGTFTNFTGIDFIDELIRRKEHEIWAAATVNNSIHEFHDFATAEDISAPPRLNVLLLENQRFGFASMLRQIGEGTFLNAVAAGYTNATSTNQTDDFLAGLGLSITQLLLPVSYPILRANIGDVTIGVNFSNSDRLKRLSYHELAHASHYEQVGEDYWVDVIRATVTEGGHGTFTSPNAPLLALVESWPEHVALSLMTQNYPSSALVTAATISNFTSWENNLEEIRNESQNHIPIGLYNDLIDVNSSVTEFVRDRNDFIFISDPLEDPVSGYTNTQLFSFLTPQTQSIGAFLELVRNNPGGNSEEDLNLLFSGY